MLKSLPCVIVACLASFKIGYTEESLASENIAAYVKFVEEDSADCSISDGKLILIKNTGSTKTLQIWVDRWFMDVQTADHTKQILPPTATPAPLGCSVVRAGGKQHWTIYSVKAVD